MASENETILKQVLKSKLTLLGGVIILSFILINLAQTWNRGKQIKSEIITLEEQAQNLKKDNLELTELINYLNSVAYIEEKARTDLGLKKEGEKILIIPKTETEKNLNQEAGSTKKELAESRSNIQKWWQYFFHPNDLE
ncbi:MAG: hypothetical protein A2744_03285 [Candidatus Buchananbacteria bacterium RIFCSPHIGHO2_01_FULL_44_11]|uniref:Cell division protein FtsL n=1 Tax=Candidatus Buchananbacteria bacterium RIFCSPHIGHO2_01_FULL_44_11 TaxID=1797535 RepID=A0A1G1Y288_9BACT|nr:MAG: hypothetical protein A2744_03285 [Candidatus Buchananbacteria bacterium RIFCSPHIGHO2_01_FULL_44_11]